MAEGPFFLGGELTLVDCMFAPFLERMAASLPYYKGLVVRRNPALPNLERWFRAMEGPHSGTVVAMAPGGFPAGP